MNTNFKETVKEKMLDRNIFGPLVDKTFEEFDLNHSGFLELEEFTPLINDIHRTLKLRQPTSSEIEKELKRYDIDKDGKLNKNEYKELVQDLISYTIDIL